MSSEPSLHKNHRQRLKKLFLDVGLDHFDPHNVLELLLFYSIPQKDTNELAHTLIARFGSLGAVFDAPYEELLKTPGLGEHSALLIKMIPSLARVYFTSDQEEKPIFTSEDDIGEYLVKQYIGVGNETVGLLLLDNKHKLIDFVKVFEGSVNSSSVTPRKLIEIAILRRASMVVLTHNHPRGIIIPSSFDYETTMALFHAFKAADIPMLGHFVVAGDQYYNIFDSNRDSFR